jgi:hypothetical protein
MPLPVQKQVRMALFDFFRRPPPIRDIGQLADFIDERAAFLVQKGIYDYARARSGPYSKTLLTESKFIADLNLSRWQAYPLGLAMVGEMVEGVVHSAEDRRAVLDPLSALVLDVFDRHPVPEPIGSDGWTRARGELARKLDQIGTHPPKRVIDIPESYVAHYFDLMPFARELLTPDAPTMRAYLRLTLTNMRDDLSRRMDAADMADKLRNG